MVIFLFIFLKIDCLVLDVMLEIRRISYFRTRTIGKN